MLVLQRTVPMHDLILEDILNPKVREKPEDFDEYLYIVGHGLNFNEGRQLLDTLNVSIVEYKEFTLSFHLTPSQNYSTGG